MLHHDALLEGGVVVLAAVAAIHGNLHSVEFILGVLFRVELVIRDAHIVVEKCHV